MASLIQFIQAGKFLRGNFLDREDYFKRVTDDLLKEGYITEGFNKAIIDREKEYPTGIQTMSMGVSIPHCDTEYVIKNAIIISVFDTPIKFYRMDQPDELIDIKVSFMLLIKDKESHLITLQQLVSLFQSSVLPKIVNQHSLQEVIELIKGEVFND